MNFIDETESYFISGLKYVKQLFIFNLHFIQMFPFVLFFYIYKRGLNSTECLINRLRVDRNSKTQRFIFKKL